MLFIILFLIKFSSIMALLLNKNNNNDCNFKSCLNNSTCMQISNDNFTCICLPSYSGVYCQFKNLVVSNENNNDVNTGIYLKYFHTDLLNSFNFYLYNYVLAKLRFIFFKIMHF
jgi:hypothetical protein